MSPRGRDEHQLYLFMQLMAELRPSSLGGSRVNTHSQTPDDANGQQVTILYSVNFLKSVTSQP